MASIEVKDAAGKKVEDRDLNASVFGIEPNIHVVHTVVRSQRASWRAGTHDTKTRGRVSGGRRAPVVPARAPSALRTGPAVASSSARIRVPTRSA